MEYIKVSTGIILLYDRLIELGLFTSSDVKYIKVLTGSILLYGID